MPNRTSISQNKQIKINTLIITYNRIISFENLEDDSIFLFGARQTGKSTLLQMRYPEAIYYDLLERGTFERLQRNPALLEQELTIHPDNTLIIIDELPLLPILLNQIHRLIVRKNMRFILTGSSARKLKRQGINTLGGRAMLRTLYPLVSAELVQPMHTRNLFPSSYTINIL